jgi:hypothetical protein
MSGKLASLCAGIALAAVAVALSGCGVAGSANANAPISKSQAAAYAKNVNLRASDLPEMTAVGAEHDAISESRESSALARCLGDPALNSDFAEIKSPSFRVAAPGRLEEISSSVELQPTQALARESARLVLSARGMRCLSRLLPSEAAATPTASISHLSVRRLPTPLPSVSGSFGVRISASAGPRGSTRRLPIFIDHYGFPSGNAEIGVTTLSSPRPVSAYLPLRLLATLYGRAVAYKPES